MENPKKDFQLPKELQQKLLTFLPATHGVNLCSRPDFPCKIRSLSRSKALGTELHGRILGGFKDFVQQVNRTVLGKAAQSAQHLNYVWFSSKPLRKFAFPDQLASKDAKIASMKLPGASWICRNQKPKKPSDNRFSKAKHKKSLEKQEQVMCKYRMFSLWLWKSSFQGHLEKHDT